MAEVIPMLSYEDGFAALDWLAEAFGFRELRRMTGPGGKLAHGEMAAGGGLIMLATPTPDYESPKRHRESCERARAWSAVPWVIDGVPVYVDNLDEHFRQATAGCSCSDRPHEDATASAPHQALETGPGSSSEEMGKRDQDDGNDSGATVAMSRLWSRFRESQPIAFLWQAQSGCAFRWQGRLRARTL
jgi:PhnB protein